MGRLVQKAKFVQRPRGDDLVREFPDGQIMAQQAILTNSLDPQYFINIGDDDFEFFLGQFFAHGAVAILLAVLQLGLLLRELQTMVLQLLLAELDLAGPQQERTEGFQLRHPELRLQSQFKDFLLENLPSGLSQGTGLAAGSGLEGFGGFQKIGTPGLEDREANDAIKVREYLQAGFHTELAPGTGLGLLITEAAQQPPGQEGLLIRGQVQEDRIGTRFHISEKIVG